MSTTIKMQFDIESTDPTCPLALEVMFNGAIQAQCDHVVETQHVILDIQDTVEADHELTITMSGKRPEHTQLDERGQIVKDALLRVKRVIMDDMDITQLLQQFSTYTHDHNGHSGPTQQPFYGDMGCNGQVVFRFSTPYYLWLLEHM
jgi:hypothetical protein